ncbi:FCS-Like Zinc finger 6-like [Punica granatum]|uniref:FLZ-type domain-containing protein n=2 Tax=Punica granatum TaxID=22663 RepID=A0A218VZZ7_PUNGR|nr:FCS-Like Zinc finger 6-like [Punica granatum]OWM65620.1 hypothetical protein CDL15_Pgr017117 [Punica granatum]PKI40565.1 hypothetical protein CRG98_039039 [Punica granatum]
MLLGKRPRPPMRRTASMTGITVDIGPQESSEDGLLHVSGASNPGEHVAASTHDHRNFIPAITTAGNSTTGNRWYDYDQNHLAAPAMVSPRRNPYGTTTEYMETAQFLRICGLCQRQLVPGRDIYMYRGDTAFCSLECREQRMKQDERKEKRTSSTVASVSK